MLKIIPKNAALGAEIQNLNLNGSLADAVRDEILQAWHQHLVLHFPGQSLGDQKLMEFGSHFGDLELSPSTEYTKDFGEMEGVPPQVTVVSNIENNGKALGTLGAGEAAWHSDSSFINTPPSASILHGIEVPTSGGNTVFANMYAAYETLSSEVKKKIEGLRTIHSDAYTSAGVLRKGRDHPQDITKDPGPQHPIVRTHPDTGRKCLYLGRRLNSYVVGMPLEESEALLNFLWDHATRKELTWAHEWNVGDVLMWDNRCTLHRRDAFDPSARRLLHRVQVRGTRPV